MQKSAIENRSTIKTQMKITPIPQVKRPTITTVPKTQTVTIPKPVFKFSSTAKTTTPTAATTKLKQEIKTEHDEDQQGSIKRKREDDEFDM